MKSPRILITSIATILGTPLLGQAPPPVVVVEEEVRPLAPPPRQVVTEEVVTETVHPAGVPAVEPGMIRRHLSVLPRALPVTPGTTVETTETTTTLEVPGLPPRVYNTERNVVIVEGRELPYVTIPVLFVKGTAELLDAESRVALEETAAAINEVVAREPTAMFDIEGHTSTDGTAEMNLDLSARRARRVHEELTRRYGVSPSFLTAHGHGENYPKYPDGTESQMVLDRRVLVVRVR